MKKRSKRHEARKRGGFHRFDLLKKPIYARRKNMANIGHIREHRVERAIKEHPERVPMIEYCYNSIPYGELDDRLKVDILIMLKCGLALMLQIKSSRERAEQFSLEYPEIPVMVVRDEWSPERIVDEVRKILEAKL